jgi:hypothetical protein
MILNLLPIKLQEIGHKKKHPTCTHPLLFPLSAVALPKHNICRVEKMNGNLKDIQNVAGDSSLRSE